MSDADVQRDLGRLEVAQEASKREISELREDVKELQRTVQTLLLEIQDRKGGTKYLFAALTIAAAIGGLADRLLTWFKLFN